MTGPRAISAGLLLYLHVWMGFQSGASRIAGRQPFQKIRGGFFLMESIDHEQRLRIRIHLGPLVLGIDKGRVDRESLIDVLRDVTDQMVNLPSKPNPSAACVQTHAYKRDDLFPRFAVWVNSKRL